MTKKLLLTLVLTLGALTSVQSTFANYYYGRYANGYYKGADNNCCQVESCGCRGNVGYNGRGYGRYAYRPGLFRRGYYNGSRPGIVRRTVNTTANVANGAVDTAAGITNAVLP